MTEPIDLKLKQDDLGIFHINIIENGDFEMDDGFVTPIVMSTYLERRANEVEVPEPRKRRGWIGNEDGDFPGFEMGSKLWLYIEQGRLTDDTINNIEAAARDGYQWFIEDNLATSVRVDAFEDDVAVYLSVELFVGNDSINSRLFELWKNTDAVEST
jgi:phage gp46-like protein